MNKQTRAALAVILERLDGIKTDLEELAEGERGKVDNMPESLLYTEKGEALEAAASALEEGVSTLEELAETLQEYTEPA